jgi:gp16 family phage-associated protein
MGKVRQLRTRDQLLTSLEESGLTVAGLAERLGVPRTALSDMLHGRHKGRRGRAHDLAVFFRLKTGTITKLTHLEKMRAPL